MSESVWIGCKKNSNVKKTHTDENGLFYNMMHNVTFKCRGEKCVGGLRPKNHSTVLVYMNTRTNEHTPTQKR